MGAGFFNKAVHAIRFLILMVLFISVSNTPSSASETVFTYRSSYVEWQVKFLNVGSDGLLTNTLYEVDVSAKAFSNPTFLLADPDNPGCRPLIPLYRIKPEEMLRNVIWNHSARIGFETRGQLQKIIEDPWSEDSPEEDMFIETWVDESGNNHVNGTRDNNFEEYLTLNSQNGVSRRQPLEVTFKRPGDYLLSFTFYSRQSSFPQNFGSANCRQGSYSQSLNWNQQVRIPMSSVKDKALAEAEAKAKAEAEAKAAAELKAKQEAEAKAKADAAKKKTSITCVKGKSSLKVIGKNPKCPSGYRKK